LSEFTHILERVEHGDPKAAAALGIAVPIAKQWWACARS
jgi:hypothetical protein